MSSNKYPLCTVSVLGARFSGPDPSFVITIPLIRKDKGQSHKITLAFDRLITVILLYIFVSLLLSIHQSYCTSSEDIPVYTLSLFQSVPAGIMAIFDENSVPDQEALQQMDAWIASGEQSSEIDLGNTQFDEPKEIQPSTTDGNYSGQSLMNDVLDLPACSRCPNCSSNLPQVEQSPIHTNDQRPFSRAYPPLDQLAIPPRPYFVGTQDFTVNGINDPLLWDNRTDTLQEQSLTQEQDLWNNFLTPPLLYGPKTDEHLHQDADSLQHNHPVLDDTALAQPSETFDPRTSSRHPQRPPVVPIHSKPNSGLAMENQPSPTTNANDTEWYSSVQPVQGGRKRKLDSPAIEISSDDDSPVASSLRQAKKRRMIEKATLQQANNIARPKQGKVNNHIRTRNIHQFDAAKVYSRPHPPADWSIFEYTEDGELERGRRYKSSEIKEYLFDHPLHRLANGTYDPKNGGLRLWIQRNPADSARRYPSTESNRCRFEECFATYNVINQGHIRVCFDESQSYLDGGDGKADPFYCAGFVHLNCLERLLDFPSICSTLPIMPDCRELCNEPRGVNGMVLSPYSSVDVTAAFISKCEQHSLVGYPYRARPHEGSLTWRIVQNKVQKEYPKLRVARKEGVRLQASHNVGHLGDLELEAKVRDLTRRAKYQVKRTKRLVSDTSVAVDNAL
ncbi:MAG: hypothetical protein Q9228_005072 [Teloschistes exilis]